MNVSIIRRRLLLLFTDNQCRLSNYKADTIDITYNSYSASTGFNFRYSILTISKQLVFRLFKYYCRYFLVVPQWHLSRHQTSFAVHLTSDRDRWIWHSICVNFVKVNHTSMNIGLGSVNKWEVYALSCALLYHHTSEITNLRNTNHTSCTARNSSKLLKFRYDFTQIGNKYTKITTNLLRRICSIIVHTRSIMTAV